MKKAFEHAAVQMGTNADLRKKIVPQRQYGEYSKPANAPYYPVDRRQMGHDQGQPTPRQMG